MAMWAAKGLTGMEHHKTAVDDAVANSIENAAESLESVIDEMAQRGQLTEDDREQLKFRADILTSELTACLN